jgi:aminoglycoside 2'-N-acetyltransferase I
VDGTVGIAVATTAELGDEVLAAVRTLFFDVFDVDFDEHDWQHCLGGIHALARDGSGRLIGHASIVPRTLWIGERPFHTGYVEGMAVLGTARRQGIGTRLMAPVHHIIDTEYELGALTSSVVGLHFYRELGWWNWKGTAWVLTREGRRVRTPAEDGAIFVRAGTKALDARAARHGEITCDWRPGDVW